MCQQNFLLKTTKIISVFLLSAIALGGVLTNSSLAMKEEGEDKKPPVNKQPPVLPCSQIQLPPNSAFHLVVIGQNRRPMQEVQPSLAGGVQLTEFWGGPAPSNQVQEDNQSKKRARDEDTARYTVEPPHKIRKTGDRPLQCCKDRKNIEPSEDFIPFKVNDDLNDLNTVALLSTSFYRIARAVQTRQMWADSWHMFPLVEAALKGKMEEGQLILSGHYIAHGQDAFLLPLVHSIFCKLQMPFNRINKASISDIMDHIGVRCFAIASNAPEYRGYVPQWLQTDSIPLITNGQNPEEEIEQISSAIFADINNQ
jgi:hypothetical protein